MLPLARPFTGRGAGAGLVCLAAILLTAGAVESPTGRVEGTVRDTGGAPIANAQVFIVGTALNALTDNAGTYRIAQIPTGTYSVRAAFIGYKSTQVDQVPVEAERATTVDIILEQTAVEVQEITVITYGPLAPRDEGATVRTGPSSAEFGAAGLYADGLPVEPYRIPTEPGNTENYARIEESRFLTVAANPLSTFSIDVDAASYTNVRRFLTSGQRPPRDAVRIEELLNYFRYRYPEPQGRDAFSISTDVAVAPWAPEHRLVRIGIKGRELSARQVPPSNLVFLLDVSGSMQSPDKLPLVKQCFRLLVEQLRPEDRVAIVVYAGAAGLVLPSTPGSDKATILSALDRLEAGGSTAGGAGLRLAYEVARRYYDGEGNNRVILATDGDLNVGESSDAAMVQLIEERRDQGVFLTVLGFGTGNLKDSRMEQIADKGNGHYAYVDNLKEGRRVFVREFAGTLVTIAKDVKIQVEFNPARVAGYRLLGYENRALRTEDFADDRKDAGELGAGHTVTALYEVIPAGAPLAALEGMPDSLKYQQVSLRPGVGSTKEWLTVQLRYKQPTGTRSRLLTHPVRVRELLSPPAEDLRFAAAVAAFGMVLRDSEHRGTATLDQVLSLARGAEGEDPNGDRAEFVRLVESARALSLVPHGVVE